MRANRPSLPVLALSIYDEAPAASPALRADATDYLTKDCSPEVLLTTICKHADGGGRLIDPELVDTSVFETHCGDVSPQDVLPEREFQVPQMRGGGEEPQRNCRRVFA